MANKLSDVMEKMNLGNKRSFTQAVLDDMAQEETVSKKVFCLRRVRIASTWGPLGPAGRRINKGLGSPIRPAKDSILFCTRTPRVFVPEPPLCSGGTWWG